MGVLRRLREWGEKRDGTLEGPALHTDEATIDGSRVYVQAEEPEDPDEEDVWIDTSE